MIATSYDSVVNSKTTYRPIKSHVRFHNSRTDILRISDLRKFELDSLYPENSKQSIDTLLAYVDLLSQYAGSETCSKQSREHIFALKNMVLTILWNQHRSIFKACWLHSSEHKQLRCRNCNGSGCQQNRLHAPCKRCNGTGMWKSEDHFVMSVFALQGYSYRTTWHIPKPAVNGILGRDIPYVDDQIQSQEWEISSMKKLPIFLTTDQLQEFLSFVVWFVLRNSQKGRQIR